MNIFMYVGKAVDKMYHDFGFKKTAVVAAVKVPDCPIIETIEKEI